MKPDEGIMGLEGGLLDVNPSPFQLGHEALGEDLVHPQLLGGYHPGALDGPLGQHPGHYGGGVGRGPRHRRHPRLVVESVDDPVPVAGILAAGFSSDLDVHREEVPDLGFPEGSLEEACGNQAGLNLGSLHGYALVAEEAEFSEEFDLLYVASVSEGLLPHVLDFREGHGEGAQPIGVECLEVSNSGEVDLLEAAQGRDLDFFAVLDDGDLSYVFVDEAFRGPRDGVSEGGYGGLGYTPHHDVGFSDLVEA